MQHRVKNHSLVYIIITITDQLSIHSTTTTITIIIIYDRELNLDYIRGKLESCRDH